MCDFLLREGYGKFCQESQTCDEVNCQISFIVHNGLVCFAGTNKSTTLCTSMVLHVLVLGKCYLRKSLELRYAVVLDHLFPQRVPWHLDIEIGVPKFYGWGS